MTEPRFYPQLRAKAAATLQKEIEAISPDAVIQTLKKSSWHLWDFPVLVSPAAAPFLETMAQHSARLTRVRHGRTISLYAPLYLSNFCVNACTYCGFNVQHQMDRHTLSLEEVRREAQSLRNLGIQHVLLVAGESKKEVPLSYLCDVARQLHPWFASLSIEVAPMDEDAYRPLVASGITGIAVYQETYHEDRYRLFHRGPKADFLYRLETADRAGRAGFRDIGIGALIGLSPFESEMVFLAQHAAFLIKHFWRSRLSLSFPRIRQAEGGFQPLVDIDDTKLAQAIFALRMVFPDADLVLSTRENRTFRDGMMGLGITRMSAGSKTTPGGYTTPSEDLEQFAVSDERTPMELAHVFKSKGIDPVWKDFDPGFVSLAQPPRGTSV
jgi:2-iminoacetate synthase